jgi:hypothetical protein
MQKFSVSLKEYFVELQDPIGDFLKVFFPTIKTYDTREIAVDRLIPKRFLAKYREINAASNLTSYNPGMGVTYEPPILDETTNIDEELAHSVVAGLEADAPASERHTLLTAQIVADHDARFTRALVKQAFDILTTGKFQPVGKDNKPVGTVFDFGRNSANTITGAYGSASPTPMQQLLDGYDQYIKNHGPKSRVVALIGDTVFGRLQDDSAFQTAMKLQGLYPGVVYIKGDNRMIAHIIEMPVPKRAGRFEILSFSGDYEEESSAGEFKQYMDPLGVIITSLDSPRLQAYAGIWVVDTQTKRGKVYEGRLINNVVCSESPDILGLRSRSAPLLIPGNIDHTVYVKSSN